jgi:hypothetical protein
MSSNDDDIEIVSGYEYGDMDGYDYIGKDDDGEPEFVAWGDTGGDDDE